jgi:hypothetical protein
MYGHFPLVWRLIGAGFSLKALVRASCTPCNVPMPEPKASILDTSLSEDGYLRVFFRAGLWLILCREQN